MKLRIGTRQSKLAIIQAETVKRNLESLDSSLDLQIVPIQTTGDKEKNKDLTKIGGKGLFLKEIQEELLAKNIDIAVHSMKDIPAFTPEGIKLAAVLEREDPRDVFISKNGKGLMEIEGGSVIGTSSPRRRVQIYNLRPDLKIEFFRGNVDSRLKKVEEGIVDGTLLAMAGLKRLGVYKSDYEALGVDKIVPAVCQGIIGIETLEKNTPAIELLLTIDHKETHLRAKAERGFLESIEGNCNTPMGAIAELVGGKLRLRCFLASEDGANIFKEEGEAEYSMAYELGAAIGKKLLSKMG
jgi:hydroxymethylbilane synthase